MGKEGPTNSKEWAKEHLNFIAAIRRTENKFSEVTEHLRDMVSGESRIDWALMTYYDYPSMDALDKDYDNATQRFEKEFVNAKN